MVKIYTTIWFYTLLQNITISEKITISVKIKCLCVMLPASYEDKNIPSNIIVYTYYIFKMSSSTCKIGHSSTFYKSEFIILRG
jgi:hypothetical protein